MLLLVVSKVCLHSVVVQCLVLKVLLKVWLLDRVNVLKALLKVWLLDKVVNVLRVLLKVVKVSRMCF